MLKLDVEDFNYHAKLNFISILYGFYSSQAAVQVLCCACKCHSEVEELKKEKCASRLGCWRGSWKIIFNLCLWLLSIAANVCFIHSS